MGFFECCHKCVPPKRYPGCSGTCPEYAEQRVLFDAQKEAIRKASQIRPAKTDYLNNAVWRTKKN